jgi:pimeloyl-ACP methyl ester carboxylesterase
MTSHRRRFLCWLLPAAGLLVVLVVCTAWGGGKPKAPEQPKSGPGGSTYAHGGMTEDSVGKGGTKAWFFEPKDPKPDSAPVVVLLHGWGSWGPVVYKRWIKHLVRRGNIVIHPKYQSSHVTPPIEMTDNAIAGIRAALAELDKAGHVKPDRTKVAVVGHSLGAVIAANLAARAQANKLPQPKTVMCIQPGDPKYARFGQRAKDQLGVEFVSIMADYAKIPKGTLMLVLVGDADKVVADDTAKLMWKAVAHLPAADRDYITVVSDLRGKPKLKTLHIFPTAPTKGSVVDWTKAGTDALDYYCTWKLLDGVTDAAFYGKNRKYALGNTPEQRFMGKWSDGTPVRELKILKK